MTDIVLAAWMVFAATGAGLLLAPRDLWRERAALRVSLAFCLGSGVLIGLVFASGMTGTLHGFGRWGILPPVTVAAAWGWKRERTILGRLVRELFGERSRLLTFLWVLLGLLLLENFLAALTPEVRHDAIDYHIQFPNLYAVKGGITDEPWSVMSYLPFNMEMLYTLALLWGGDTACKLLHFSFGAVTALAAIGLGARFHRLRTGLAAAVLFALTPQVARISMTSFNDLAAAAFVTMALGLWFEHWDSRMAGTGRASGPGVHLWFAAVMMGLALGVKWSVFPIFFMPILVTHAWFLFAGRFPRRVVVSESALLLILPLVLFSPWCLRNLAFTGNPVYPFLNGRFGLTGPAARAAEEFIQTTRPPTGTYHFPEILEYWRGRLRDIGLAGSVLVYLFLILAPLAALSGLFRTRRRPRPGDTPAPRRTADLPRRAGTGHEEVFAGFPGRPTVWNLSLIFLLLSGLGFLLFTYNADGRFLLPAYPVMALVTVRCLESLAEAWAVARESERREPAAGGGGAYPRALVVLLAALLAGSAYHQVNFHRDLREPWLPVLGEQREEFLRARYPVLPVLNGLPRDSLVLGAGFPARVPYLPKVKAGVNAIEELTGPRPYSAETLYRALRQAGVTHIFEPNGYPVDRSVLEEVEKRYAKVAAEGGGQRLYLLTGAELVDSGRR